MCIGVEMWWQNDNIGVETLLQIYMQKAAMVILCWSFQVDGFHPGGIPAQRGRGYVDERHGAIPGRRCDPGGGGLGRRRAPPASQDGQVEGQEGQEARQEGKGQGKGQEEEGEQANLVLFLGS